jgi:hypothetical protein
MVQGSEVGNGQVLHILSQHLADLRRSGLSEDQIHLCGFESLTHSDRIAQTLRWKRYRGQLGPCLAIPFFDCDVSPTGY